MKIISLVFGIAVAVAGASACKSKPSERGPENTGQNDRDKKAVPTADQAGQNKSDTDLAQQVRKAITGDGSLSTNAHNCKVVVNDGVITLAGPVASDDERTKVANLASGAAGGAKVVNQLEVAN